MTDQRLVAVELDQLTIGKADEAANVAAYERFLQPALDAESRAYWERRDLTGRKRISLFARDLYHHGLLGYFIGLGHGIARLYGVDPRDLLKARTMDEQRSVLSSTGAEWDSTDIRDALSMLHDDVRCRALSCDVVRHGFRALTMS